MQIQILPLIAGAKAARGLTVIIDVFRASNTIIACLAGGAQSVLPVGELEEALQLKKENPDHLLFGERKGLKPNGFDYGNSPAEASRLDLRGKNIILTTSAGSQGIIHAKKADEILIGSFANASALVQYLQNKAPNQITLVPMGDAGTKAAAEDEACAEYLKTKLQGKEIDFNTLISQILEGEGARRLKKLGQDEDLEFCLRLDSYNIVPKVDRKSGKIKS